MSKIQAVIDRGILEEDPDGRLFLSAKARDVVSAIEGDDKLMAALKKKATDDDDEQIGFWTLVYMKHCGVATSEEVADAVDVLVGWHEAARENRLNEWSMQLRLGRT